MLTTDDVLSLVVELVVSKADVLTTDVEFSNDVKLTTDVELSISVE